MPSNLAVKRFGSVWIAFLVIAFGAIVIGEAFVQSYSGLLGVRFILGLAEGGTLVRIYTFFLVLHQSHLYHKSGLVYILSRVRMKHPDIRRFWKLIRFGMKISIILVANLFYVLESSLGHPPHLRVAVRDSSHQLRAGFSDISLVGGLLASGLLSVPDFGKVQRWRKVCVIFCEHSLLWILIVGPDIFD